MFEIYYTLIDCCSGEQYVYPEGHYLAGYPMYIIYTGAVSGYTPDEIISQAEIITSIEDSLGFKVEGCLILKPSVAPVGNPPINLQNWADVFFTNLEATPMCCDCNNSCNSLFFQFSDVTDIQYGQQIYSFIGPTGNYNGRNYYQIITGYVILYVWYSALDEAWYLTEVLGDNSDDYYILNSTEQIPATEGIITNWTAGFPTSSVFQSYTCKAVEPVVTPAELAYPEERYQLTCCSTGEALKINGLPAVFVFKGITSNDNHPDNYLEVVLTTIKDINANVITGCFRVTEAECYEEWEELLWENFFVLTECVDTCEECLPQPEIIPAITNHKIIYPDYKIDNVDPYEAEKIYCAFGDANYEKVLALRFGIQFCCPTDLMQSTIEHEILKMDVTEDPNACCPPEPVPGTCKVYTITIPGSIEGYLYFKDCNNVVRTVQFYEASVAYNVLVCGIAGQTSQNIYVLANNQVIIPVQFVQGVDCN